MTSRSRRPRRPDRRPCPRPLTPGALPAGAGQPSPASPSPREASPREASPRGPCRRGCNEASPGGPSHREANPIAVSNRRAAPCEPDRTAGLHRPVAGVRAGDKVPVQRPGPGDARLGVRERSGQAVEFGEDRVHPGGVERVRDPQRPDPRAAFPERLRPAGPVGRQPSRGANLRAEDPGAEHPSAGGQAPDGSAAADGADGQDEAEDPDRGGAA